MQQTVSKNAPLAVKLNALGRNYVTLPELKEMGVTVQAATTRTTSFIGKYLGVKIYGYYCYTAKKWRIERA